MQVEAPLILLPDINPDDVMMIQPFPALDRRPFRFRCQKPKCCRCCLWFKHYNPVEQKEQQALVPLKSVNIQGTLEAGHANLCMQLTYVNAGASNPIECTFEYPIEASTVVSKLIAQIDDRIVEAKIKAKEDAKEQYDDAIASGNAAVYAQRDTKHNEESITLVLGNLMPG